MNNITSIKYLLIVFIDYIYLVLNKNKLPEALSIATFDYLYSIPINANKIKPMFIFKHEKHTSITLNKELLALA